MNDVGKLEIAKRESNYELLRIISSAFFLFAFFSKLHIPYNKLINKIASNMFGVYFIQCHPVFGNYIWRTLFNFEGMRDSKYYILYSNGLLTDYRICDYRFMQYSIIFKI